MKSGKSAKNVINMEGKRLEKIREQLLLRIKIKKSPENKTVSTLIK